MEVRLAGARRSDLDWMRLMLALVAFLSSCARLSSGRVYGINFLPALFLVISAGAVRSALDFQSVSAFIVAKVLRLFIPLVFGVLVLAPPQAYLERLAMGDFSGTFLQFLPRYFDWSNGLRGGDFASCGLHLWYLLVLFPFSLLLLPLFRAMRSSAGRRVTSRFASFVSIPGFLYALGLALAVPRALIAWNLGFYAVVFILGYLLFSESELQRLLVRRRHLSCLLAALLAAASKALPAAVALPDFAFILARALAGWSLALALLGYGLRHFGSAATVPVYLNEAVLPLYLLSRPVILAVGYALAGWTAAPALKQAAIVVISLAVIASLYEGIRRLNMLRFLFGLRPIDAPKSP